MNNIEERELASFWRRLPPLSIVTVVLSLFAIAATILVSSSSLEVVTRTRAFSGVIGAYLVICALLYFWHSRHVRARMAEDAVDEHLSTLDEINEFFGHTLKPADAFRLATSRVRNFFSYRSAVLLLLDEDGKDLEASAVDGTDPAFEQGAILSPKEGLIGECIAGGWAKADADGSVAIPLLRDGSVFGVLHLQPKTAVELSLCEAIGARIAPLIVSSMAFERSQTNALVDVTTDLANERAFYLILENQIAEAMRRRGNRPLTVLAIDVKGFDEINRRFGHAAGDEVLAQVADTVKDNVRQMDVLARSSNDEFLALLPTASKEVSSEIIARIQSGFFGRRIRLSDEDNVEIELNFGWAACGEDGETADQLVCVARLRKDQAKYAIGDNLLRFSKELVK